MALTSPDNIWTPDSSDNYALTTDLAAMADSIQDAITKRANYGVGTTAEMNAAVSRFPDGAMWYNVTNSTEYRRVAGAWVLHAEDTGWVNVSLAAGWTTPNIAQLRFFNGSVYGRGYIVNSSLTGGYEIAVPSLPSGIPSPQGVDRRFASMTNTTVPSSIRVTTTGVIDIWRNSVSGGWISLAAIAYTP